MTNIFVAKLDYGVTNEELKNLFEAFGKVLKVSIPTDKDTGKSKGFAFIEMLNENEALNAIQSLDQKIINGRSIAVKIADNKANNNRKDFSQNSQTNQRFDKKEKVDNPDNKVIPPVINPIESIEKRRDVFKKKDKKVSFDDNKPRQKKMETYKKSGKSNRFINYDDDDDLF